MCIYILLCLNFSQYEQHNLHFILIADSQKYRQTYVNALCLGFFLAMCKLKSISQSYNTINNTILIILLTGKLVMLLPSMLNSSMPEQLDRVSGKLDSWLYLKIIKHSWFDDKQISHGSELMKMFSVCTQIMKIYVSQKVS